LPTLSRMLRRTADGRSGSQAASRAAKQKIRRPSPQRQMKAGPCTTASRLEEGQRAAARMYVKCTAVRLALHVPCGDRYVRAAAYRGRGSMGTGPSEDCTTVCCGANWPVADRRVCSAMSATGESRLEMRSRPLVTRRGNLTGVSISNTELGPKQLELLHELVPTASTIALLVNPTNRTVAPTADDSTTGRPSGINSTYMTKAAANGRTRRFYRLAPRPGAPLSYQLYGIIPSAG
jgi:hypothetical protein